MILCVRDFESGHLLSLFHVLPVWLGYSYLTATKTQKRLIFSSDSGLSEFTLDHTVYEGSQGYSIIAC